MYAIYNLIVKISWVGLRFLSLFNTKLKLFVSGRKASFDILEAAISKGDNILWLHVASLGEFEQGLPIIEKLRSEYPSHKILVTFFSPSGYEVKKDTKAADIVCYLPMDTRKNASRFLDMVRPELAIFVKYEIWPNYLRELDKRKVPTLLISAILEKRQVFFKWYGSFMRKALRRFDHFFLQNESSQQLLASIDITDTTVSGDTRLDRVSEILERDNHLDFMRAFKKDRLCFVAGSTWPEDERILIDYINHAPKNLKYVLAPHTIKKDKVLGLAGAITKKKILYSDMIRMARGDIPIGEEAIGKETIPRGGSGNETTPHNGTGDKTISKGGSGNTKIPSRDVGDIDVLIVDTIGLLTRIYSFADIAYVGGGFATGLHNTLEPAVFGIAVIIGPQYAGFKEAEDLVALKGILPVKDEWTFGELMKKLQDQPEFRKKTGSINAEYIARNKGASQKIMAFIRTLPIGKVPS